MNSFRIAPYACTRTKNLSRGSSSALRIFSSRCDPRPPVRYYSYAVQKNETPFRMAVIGSGPAGFYTAYKVMANIDNAIVDMYEHLPVPYGLVRFGVAPDHPEVKVWSRP